MGDKSTVGMRLTPPVQAFRGKLADKEPLPLRYFSDGGKHDRERFLQDNSEQVQQLKKKYRFNLFENDWFQSTFAENVAEISPADAAYLFRHSAVNNPVLPPYVDGLVRSHIDVDGNDKISKDELLTYAYLLDSVLGNGNGVVDDAERLMSERLYTREQFYEVVEGSDLSEGDKLKLKQLLEAGTYRMENFDLLHHWESKKYEASVSTTKLEQHHLKTLTTLLSSPELTMLQQKTLQNKWCRLFLKSGNLPRVVMDTEKNSLFVIAKKASAKHGVLHQKDWVYKIEKNGDATKMVSSVVRSEKLPNEKNVEPLTDKQKTLIQQEYENKKQALLEALHRQKDVKVEGESIASLVQQLKGVSFEIGSGQADAMAQAQSILSKLKKRLDAVFNTRFPVALTDITKRDFDECGCEHVDDRQERLQTIGSHNYVDKKQELYYTSIVETLQRQLSNSPPAKQQAVIFKDILQTLIHETTHEWQYKGFMKRPFKDKLSKEYQKEAQHYASPCTLQRFYGTASEKSFKYYQSQLLETHARDMANAMWNVLMPEN